MPWLRLSVCADADRADEIEARLVAAGAAAVTLSPEDDSVEDVLEPGPGGMPLWHSVRIEGLFAVESGWPDLGRTGCAAQAKPPGGFEALSTLSGIDFDIDFLGDRDWSETWREGFGPRRFGRLVVQPKAFKVEPRAEDVVVRLDPGLAFGTGTHATTALCLDRLARMPLAGKRVLDVGSGSGILAIAAVRLGATAIAVDHDPQARRATLENSRDNGVDVGIATGLGDIDSRFDVVLANLVAGTIRDLAGALLERLAPGGELVLSGILSGQVEWVMDTFSGEAEFRFEVPTFRDGWAMLRGLRCPNPTNR